MENLTPQEELCYMLWQSRIGIRKVLIAMLHQKTQEDVEKMLKQITNIIIEQEGDFNKIKNQYEKLIFFTDIENLDEVFVNAEYIKAKTIHSLLIYSLLEKNLEKEDIIGIIYPIINNELAQRSMILEVINNNFTIEELLKLSAYMHENYIFK